jgi:hypothetical protein
VRASTVKIGLEYCASLDVEEGGVEEGGVEEGGVEEEVFDEAAFVGAGLDTVPNDVPNPLTPEMSIGLTNPYLSLTLFYITNRLVELTV